MNQLQVQQGGFCATVQDLGRHGYQAIGVCVGGVMDSLSARLANNLVGNAETTPLIEIALYGTELSFSEPTLIAITGAGFAPSRRRRPRAVESTGAHSRRK